MPPNRSPTPSRKRKRSPARTAPFDAGVVDSQISSLTQLFDIRNGGFGTRTEISALFFARLDSGAVPAHAPPAAPTAESICWPWPRPRWKKWPAAACTTSSRGGFHRYSVDERWLVPHFEKMSYDNSELLKNYLHGWQVTQNPLLAANRRRHHSLGQRSLVRPASRRILRQPGCRLFARR